MSLLENKMRLYNQQNTNKKVTKRITRSISLEALTRAGATPIIHRLTKHRSTPTNITLQPGKINLQIRVLRHRKAGSYKHHWILSTERANRNDNTNSEQRNIYTLLYNIHKHHLTV